MIILFIDHTAQNMKFSIKDFFSKCDQIRLRKFTEEMYWTFTEEIFNGKHHFLCSVNKLCLNKHVFERNPWFNFCHVCRTLNKTTLMLFLSRTVVKHYPALVQAIMWQRHFPKYFSKLWNPNYTFLLKYFFSQKNQCYIT